MGTEGVVLTKRVAVPRQSEYDRSVIWLLDCQAEGDRLLRLDVEIDWGEPLTQRMVDGLLVAQRNPGPEQGIYNQSNAELTCVFGNPQARPVEANLQSDQHAHLVYHVLVNGMVEVPLLLAISDVGEQVAWNGFLALRDADRAFELSGKAWETLLKTGRLWTPDVALNQQVQSAKMAAVRQIQRIRTGFVATDRRVEQSAALVDLTDLHDRVLSRNLLAHLRRVAEATTGQLPVTLPARPREPAAAPGATLIANNTAYLAALRRHLSHHFEAKLLADHYDAVGLCVEQILRQLMAGENGSQADCDLAALWADIEQLTQWQADEENRGRWQQAFASHLPTAGVDGAGTQTTDSDWLTPPDAATLRCPPGAPWSFGDPWAAIRWAGATVWRGCGLQWQEGELWVTPNWPAAWQWWALMDLPYIDDRTLTLLWDGTTLHSTQPIRSDCPTQLWDRIRTRRTDELEFDPYFELQSEVGAEVHVSMVQLSFSKPVNAP